MPQTTNFLDSLEQNLAWMSEHIADALTDAEHLCETSDNDEDRWWRALIRERVKMLDANRTSLVATIARYRELAG